MMPEEPRFTRSLRAFTNLGRKKEQSVGRTTNLIKKKLEQADLLKRKYSWQEFCKHLPNGAGIFLSKIRNATAKLCEGELPSVVDHITISVLQILINEKYVTEKNMKRLENMIVGITREMINELMQAVIKIKEYLTDEHIEYIVTFDKETSNDDTAEISRFGENIDYKPATIVWPDTRVLHDMCHINVSRPANDFTMSYEKIAQVTDKETFDKSVFSKGLKQCYEKYSTAMTYNEFVGTIEEKLKNSDDNLENELFDLLGFENIQFIGYLIKHRHSIASSIANQKSRKIVPATILEQPGYGCQVTVQSKREKELLKQVRKEEKKLMRASNRHDADEDLSDDDIDPIILRMKRQEVLLEQRAPILLSSKIKAMFGSGSAREKFPFVFDTKLTSKITAGVVSGKNIMLPENVTRKDSQLCEEVHIPIPTAEPLEVGNTPVLISSLDEIGQMAFSGVEALNRIQSIVFDAAYNSHENLLICAPTGAGKTNVAMLTIVHQLKLHMDNGLLKKNEFKIIYIAPMKALAAEMTSNFNKKLGCLGVVVRELTGDMQLTKTEIQQTQMIVTTPEKWDVVTRKGSGDIALTSIVKLLIIDEVHLLHGDRGPVVEALVARTLRQVESSQSMIRIVGLSATLPNYVDVARFLRVNPYKGLFYFDHRFRPVPLSQTFVGVKSIKPSQQIHDMDVVCYNQVVDMVRKGHQVMVFVHARNATIRTANAIKDLAGQNDTLKLFKSDGAAKGLAQKALGNSRNKYLGQLFPYGFSVHHAGMLRTDRNMVEKYFSQGLIKVLVCTSTLAWGVNLPAHAVVIRGTEIYDSKHGAFIDLGILDVLQIFGRAGRPQYDTSGHAVIITTHAKLSHYLSLLTNQFPIESSFITYLADNLNAEIALGTISNVEEAVEWLSYTYLFVRMKLNHIAYGIPHQTIVDDPNLDRKRKELIETAAKALDKARMIRYHAGTGDLSATDLGRTASHYYLKYDTVEIFNDLTKPIMTEADILAMISRSQEFEQLKVRDDEMTELDNLSADYCEVIPQGGTENIHGKVNILIQTYLSQGRVNSFSLQSDQAYITQNAMRICRAIFEVMLRRNNAIMAGRLLSMAKMLEAQQWDHMSPMRQFRCLGQDIIDKIEERNLTVERLREMDVREIGDFLRNHKTASLIKKCCDEFPALEMDSSLQPITRTVLRIRLKIYPNFTWNDRIHGKSSEAFWIWIEDPENNFIYHHEYFVVTRKMVVSNGEHELVMTIPLTEPLPAQYLVKATSDRWLGCETTLPLTFHNLILPDLHPPHTDLLELQPLPITALKDSNFESLYKFSHFNPIQTQIFHCLYHTDCNALLGAPTGSGKTIAAEIAIFRVFKQYPDKKVVYIAPLKALVRERMNDWKIRIEERLGKTVVELTGDVTPDMRAVARASVIVTTPEKWDGISRSWQTRSYVKKVALIIIDEIHLLGEDRGPVLEVIVSRTNFIASHTKESLRIVGLSTALANAVDLADWLGIKKMGLYNFRPSVRPVPLEVHTSGFPGKHYCPRMATMNRPTFQAIRQHAPTSPSLVFVSSRRQTRLTALDLIAYLAAEDTPKQWLHMPEDEMNDILENIKDTNLKLTLAFGIGIHHAGLQERDRRTVEELFVNNKIQVLIATSTLAWGVNFPAHLVVIKGTEYYDGKTKRYVDMPITDVLQMMGRAGRPQYDDSGVAVVLVHDIKKNFYKKFLYEPFPVESSLLQVLPDHVNAEIVAGTIKTKQEFLDYMTWTYFFRRLMKNPRYYDLEILEPERINEYLSELVEKTLKILTDSACVEIDQEQQAIYPLSLGRIASFYYLSHITIAKFDAALQDNLTIAQCLKIMCDAHEYDEIPVRHNEDILNEELAKRCRYQVDRLSYDSPNTKAFLLLQAHFSRLVLPCADYYTDLKSVLDQSIRILQSMIDVTAERGWLTSTLRIMQLLQMIIQGRWIDESAITTLPHIKKEYLDLFTSLPKCLPALCAAFNNNLKKLNEALSKKLTTSEVQEIYEVMKSMPIISVELSLLSTLDDSNEKEVINIPLGSEVCIEVRANQNYTLLIHLRRKNRSNNLRAHCPMFLRGKDEGWFFVLGDIGARELWALKRASGINHQTRTNQLEFTAPAFTGRTTVTLYLMSDCYIGFDQQYDINLNVIA